MYMQGPAQNFYFTNDRQLYNVYIIYTMDGDANRAYLKSQDSGVIVAAALTQEPSIFRLTPQTEVPFTFPSTPQN